MKPHILFNESKHIPGVWHLRVADRAQVLHKHNSKILWKTGAILRKYGQLHYLVKLGNGYTTKHHINQLRLRVQRKKFNSTSLQNNHLHNKQKINIHTMNIFHFKHHMPHQITLQIYRYRWNLNYSRVILYIATLKSESFWAWVNNPPIWSYSKKPEFLQYT